MLTDRRYNPVFQRTPKPRRRLSVTLRRAGILIGTDGDKASFPLYPIPTDKLKDSK